MTQRVAARCACCAPHHRRETLAFDLGSASTSRLTCNFHGGRDFVDAAKALGCWVDDGRPQVQTKPTPLSLRLALSVMAFESTLAAVAAGNVANGVTLTDADRARLFMVHVGRSSRGRKGTAKKLIYRINNAVKALDEFLVPQVHRGGLSTREGLALMIHDGYKEGKNEVPAITDKRLLVVESEFANILHQSKRDGNTLSAALRDAWDGTSICPAVKTCRVWASDPHFGIIGDVTPSELRELMHARELTNGFANRFIFFWAEGDKVMPFPQYTPKDVVETLAHRVAQVLRFAGANRHVDMDVMRMEFSTEAACFGGHVSKATLDKALDELITASPPAIEVETVPRPNGQPGSPSKVYKPCPPPAQPASAANSANSAEREARWASAAGFGATRNLRSERNEGAAETQNLPEVAQFAESASRQNPALTRMDIATSQVSHISQAQTGKPNADDVEVF